MLSVIDFRNGKYQGETRGGMPEGFGIFFSVQLVFLIGHWRDGLLEGRSIIIYPDATVFCGRMKDGRAEGLCYYQLQRQKIKVYFQEQKEEKQGKLAITIPNFSKILTVDSTTLLIVAQSHFRKGDSKANMAQITKIIGKKDQIRDEYAYQGFIQYFEVHFAIPYSDILEQLIINANGFVEYLMGFKEEGLGIKVRPLPMEESGGRSYRICEMGVMTRENVLFGMGLKSTNGVLGRVQIEQGVFALPHTLTSYRLSEGPTDKTRPQKSITTFLNFLKRSMTFRDAYLTQKEVSRFKQSINRIHDLTFTEMKVKNAHQIIESPLKDESVRVEIERKRRKREEGSQQFQRAKRVNNLSNMYSSGTKLPPGSTFTLGTLRQDLERSISKRKLSKSKLNTFENTSYYDSRSKQPQKDTTNYNPNKSSQKRANGSITPTKVKRHPSQQKKQIGIIANNRLKQSPSRKSPTKYPQRDQIRQQIREQKHPVMAPILKPSPQSSPNKRIVTYRQKQLEQLEKDKLKFAKPNTNSPPKRYAANTNIRPKPPSPVKSYSRPLLTENIFN